MHIVKTVILLFPSSMNDFQVLVPSTNYKLFYTYHSQTDRLSELDHPRRERPRRICGSFTQAPSPHNGRRNILLDRHSRNSHLAGRKLSILFRQQSDQSSPKRMLLELRRFLVVQALAVLSCRQHGGVYV